MTSLVRLPGLVMVPVVLLVLQQVAFAIPVGGCRKAFDLATVEEVMALAGGDAERINRTDRNGDGHLCVKVLGNARVVYVDNTAGPEPVPTPTLTARPSPTATPSPTSPVKPTVTPSPRMPDDVHGP